MQKIEAVIRVEKQDEISEALEKYGLPGMMVTHIEGLAIRRGWLNSSGQGVQGDFHTQDKIEIVVKDQDVDKICIMRL
jgi:nitrogen regulatory protein P-II 1